ncbi:hypothetical protein HPB48_002085 [Haemaphysalis longicornis]|uniref:Uncharacterized protein n=1 Tax=Haemaphysalis longicornis TaxID=44386 RepID=A0A9J6FGM7_HAELO|nr:hypothetical protein HPB48_002085 [Haemaphysalis longicornis]
MRSVCLALVDDGWAAIFQWLHSHSGFQENEDADALTVFPHCADDPLTTVSQLSAAHSIIAQIV